MPNFFVGEDSELNRKKFEKKVIEIANDSGLSRFYDFSENDFKTYSRNKVFLMNNNILVMQQFDGEAYGLRAINPLNVIVHYYVGVESAKEFASSLRSFISELSKVYSFELLGDFHSKEFEEVENMIRLYEKIKLRYKSAKLNISQKIIYIPECGDIPFHIQMPNDNYKVLMNEKEVILAWGKEDIDNAIESREIENIILRSNFSVTRGKKEILETIINDPVIFINEKNVNSIYEILDSYSEENFAKSFNCVIEEACVITYDYYNTYLKYKDRFLYYSEKQNKVICSRDEILLIEEIMHGR